MLFKNIIISLGIVFLLTSIEACQTPKKATDPYIAFEQKQYNVAIPLLKKEYHKTKSNIAKGKIALYIAEAYQKSLNYTEAGEWYKAHYDVTEDYNSLEKYAQSLKKESNYKGASRIYKQLAKQTSRSRYFRKQAQFCSSVASWMKGNKIKYNIKSLPFNTAYSESGTYITKDGGLIYSSDKPIDKNDIYYWSGDGFSKFYTYTEETEKSTLLKSFSDKGNQGVITFNKAEDEAIYTLCTINEEDVNYCHLVSRTKEGDTWSKPALLPFMKTEQNYVHPSLSKDGKTLYFASNNLEGWGKYDIYSSVKIKGEWQSPKILSRQINTDKNELYPRIDGDVLYFSSDGLNGMGGLDIFRSHKVNNKWTKAENLKYPINSPMDDFGLFLTKETKDSLEHVFKGYVSSNRKGGQGKDDVYSIDITEDISTPPVIIEVKEPIFVLKLTFTDQNNAKVDVSTINVTKGPKIASKTDHNTLIYTGINKEALYDFNFSSKGFLNKQFKYSVPREYWDEKDSLIYLEAIVNLQKIELNKEIIIDNVYYDFNKSNLRPDAFPALNALIKVLNNNPQISIQLSSHTDCRGKDKYNLNLSQDRAQSVVDYLISKGIDKQRLIAKGYGASQPSINCNCPDCTEEEHQTNRRTTFSIINQ